jgi:hypothetical protein
METINNELASAVITGTSLGRCLKMSLEELQGEHLANHNNNNNRKDNDNNDDTSSSSSIIRLDKRSVDCILNAFGNAAVATTTCSASTTTTTTTNDESITDGSSLRPRPPPRVLLRGRCAHYNRYGRYWSISIDNVSMKQRPINIKKRRTKENRSSIWDRDTDDYTLDESNAIILIKEPIELMAYGDG